MKKIGIFAGWLLGAVLMVVACELLLRLAPVSDNIGIAAGPPRPDWPVRTLVPGAQYTYSKQWNFKNIQRGRINAEGYVAPFDYGDGRPEVAVLGDSFVENLMNEYDEGLTGVLGKALGSPKSVYNFGLMGASLPHYLGMAGLVGKRYHPSWAVVLVTSGDFVEGFAYQDGMFHWGGNEVAELAPVAYRSRLVRVIREIALVRYARANLLFTTDRLLAPGTEGPDVPVCRPQTLEKGDPELVAGFVRRLPENLGIDPSHVILVFDANREAIYAGQPQRSACPSRDELALELLRSDAKAAGVRVLETAPLFEAEYRKTGERLDLLPVDPHWNPRAHELVGKAVAAIIEKGRD